MDEQQILSRIQRLVDDERTLRERASRGELTTSEEQARLQRVEESLDQCWDLLRQRRALRDAGRDPDAARVRPPDEVEDYLQ